LSAITLKIFFSVTSTDIQSQKTKSEIQPDVDNKLEFTLGESVPKGANAEGKPRDESIRNCVDRHEQCKAFADRGECMKNPGWMIVNCPRSCNPYNNACQLRDPKLRCQREALNVSTDPIYAPGDMHNMFSSILERFGGRYEINVLSESPWVVTFDNFLNDREIHAIIETQDNWERSTDTGLTNEIGETGRILSSGRTSVNSWCRDRCREHPDVQSALSKIQEVTNVPVANYESFQVLQYENGQFYQVHHDFGGDDNKLPCGPRILTFFLYLSDVEEGGETAFPSLNIQVLPKRGRALLWPSTLSADPTHKDPRTMHEAKPVIRGKKFAANSWIHLYNYDVPNLWGCTGVFDEL